LGSFQLEPMAVKIVVFSDTHLHRVTEEFESICDHYCRDADRVIHLGDWTSASVWNFLQQYPLEGVSGNMDDMAVRLQLPARQVIRVGGFRIGMTHGYGFYGDLKEALRREFDGVDAILFGHTHRPLVEREGGQLFFNPGSVFSGRGSGRSLGLLTVGRTLQGEIVRL